MEIPKEINVEIPGKSLEAILTAFKFMQDNKVVDYAKGDVSSPQALESIINKLQEYQIQGENSVLSIPMNELEWIDFSGFLFVSHNVVSDQEQSLFLNRLYVDFSDWEDNGFQ